MWPELTTYAVLPSGEMSTSRIQPTRPRAHGWSTELWTLERIGLLLQRQFGVSYHPGHVWRILRSLGWSLQRPATRARERDEKAIEGWKKQAWPRLKKTPEGSSTSSSSTKAASRKDP